ncbi:COP1-interactive protein 1 isoform X2 [Vigna angularis]|uniref:COP1-interactive protein 1 isoform X2 n=1 Tax=Phaseolus angularis TaxID=3914 RepID=UPI0022B3641B|nr:COP1-interactive protein 1 isoform X2 [Vigna angularis]
MFDIETNISGILKFIKNESLNTEDGNLKHSTNWTEFKGLIEDLCKNHQSMYALYDRITEEFEKSVSRKRKVSSSDSESEYFSSEEVDGYRRRSEKEHYYISDFETPRQFFDKGDGTDETTNAEAQKTEEQLTLLMQEVESLSKQKSDLKQEVENQTHEVKHLTAKNTELNDEILELDSLLKKEKDKVFDLQAQLNDNENQEKPNIADLMAKICELEQEIKSLQTQKDEMEEKLKCEQSEASTQREDLMDKLDMVQQRLNFMETVNKEVEAKMESQREQIYQDSTEINNLKDNLTNMRLVEKHMVAEKNRLLYRLRDLELNLESQMSQKSELEEKLRDKNYEIKELTEENKVFQERNHELRTTMTQKGEELSNFVREHENHENGASMEVMTLKAKLNEMRLELDTMHEQKNKLEQQIERSQKEYVESLTRMENLNAKLATQIGDQEKMIEQLSEENKQAKVVFSKLKTVQVTAERKINELAEEFRRKMEDNIKLLHQRIHVAEQLNNENKYSYKITKQRYEEEYKDIGKKIAHYKDEKPTRIPNGFEFIALNGLDLAIENLEEYATRVTKMMCEVKFMMDRMREKNEEVKEMRDNVDYFRELLDKKEEQELLLRENLWILEAEVSKEGGDKLNLRKEVSQLEKKVGKLEKSVKKKEEDLVNLGEKKREAIRQLCFVIEFHRDRCNYIKDMATKNRLSNVTSKN